MTLHHSIRRLLTRTGDATGKPIAFLVVVAYVAGWLIFDRRSFDMQAVATVATWLMTLLIQRSQYRDTQAIHAKLDELLRVDSAAKSELGDLDKQEPEEIVKQRDEARVNAGDG